MQTQSEIKVVEFKLRKLSHRLNLTGWISLAIQLPLAIVAGVVLALAIQSPDLNEATTPGIAIGVFWAICGIIILLGGLYLTFRLTSLARKLRRSSSTPNTASHPVKSEVIKLLRVGIMVGLIGMLLMIVGEGVTLIALLVKAVTQPKPGAIYDANELIRSLDIFVALSNISGIMAHFVGTLTSLSLLNWFQRQ